MRKIWLFSIAPLAGHNLQSFKINCVHALLFKSFVISASSQNDFLLKPEKSSKSRSVFFES